MKKNNFLNSLAFAIFLTATTSAQSQTTILNFDDGANNVPIDNFYVDSGVTFSNAFWFPNVSCNTGQPFMGASPGPFAINRFAGGGCPQVVDRSSPIMAIFSSPVTTVTITALDIGDAGARMDAYDAVVGGNLVASEEVYGGGIGVYNFFILTNNAASIRRVEMYQPSANGSDGIVFDTLTFSPSPVPLFLGITTTNQQMHVHLTGPIGNSYIIQAADVLTTNTVWNDLITNSLSHGVLFDFTDTQATNAMRFYRAKMQ